MSAHLYDALTARFPKRDKPFLRTPEGRELSYRGLEEGSGRIASVLRDLSVGPGDRVAVQVEKSPEAVLLYLACLRAGATFLPLNTAYTPAEIAYFLADAEPKVFVCEPVRRDQLSPAAKKARVAHVETLDEGGSGSLMEKAASATPNPAATRPSIWTSPRSAPAAASTSPVSGWVTSTAAERAYAAVSAFSALTTVPSSRRSPIPPRAVRSWPASIR